MNYALKTGMEGVERRCTYLRPFIVGVPCVYISRRNILEEILAYPRSQNPGHSLVLRGLLLAVHFRDRALPTVGSTFWPYSRGPNRPFLDSHRTLAYSTDLWACFKRDPEVRHRSYVGVCGCSNEQ
jgi:hypothetical protein